MTVSDDIVRPDLTRDKLIAELRGLRPALERKGVTHLALFGSRARGDNRPDSDVDLLVDIRGGMRFSLLDLIAVGHIVEDHLGLATSMVMREGLGERFRSEIENDVTELF